YRRGNRCRRRSGVPCDAALSASRRGARRAVSAEGFLTRPLACPRASRCVEARRDDAARASEGRRLSCGLVEAVRQGPRLLFDSWSRCGGLGQPAAAENVCRGDPLVPRSDGVTMKRRSMVMGCVAVMVTVAWGGLDAVQQQAPGQGRGRGGGRGAAP